MEVRFLEGHLSWEGSSRKALRPGGEDLEIPFPHSTRSPQLGSEWSWLGNPAKTFRNPSEGNTRYRIGLQVKHWRIMSWQDHGERRLYAGHCLFFR